MNPFKPGEAPAVLQFLTNSRAQLSNKFPELITVWVRWHLKIGLPKCRISGKSVTDVLWAYNTENISAESLSSSSKSLEIVPRPCPLCCASLGALATDGESLRQMVLHMAAAVLMAAGQSRGLKTGCVGLRHWPSGQEFLISSKTFSQLYLFPEIADCRGTGSVLFVWWPFLPRRACLQGGTAPFWGLHNTTLTLCHVGAGPEDLQWQ